MSLSRVGSNPLLCILLLAGMTFAGGCGKGPTSETVESVAASDVSHLQGGEAWGLSPRGLAYRRSIVVTKEGRLEETRYRAAVSESQARAAIKTIVQNWDAANDDSAGVVDEVRLHVKVRCGSSIHPVGGWWSRPKPALRRMFDAIKATYGAGKNESVEYTGPVQWEWMP